MLDGVMHKTNISEVQKEKDLMFMLLAYALVNEDWQGSEVPHNHRRGYNIGCVLVDDHNVPVYHGLNCINSTENATQHGEVRAITQYLGKYKGFNLKGFTIYSTLEPCIMCAGMITMTAIKRVVYGQKDVDYSHAFERLAIDTRIAGGFAPYPRQVDVCQSNDDISSLLDIKYQEFLKNDTEKVLARFLSSEEGKKVYVLAQKKFLNFHLRFSENKAVYQRALKYYNHSKSEHE